MTKEGKARKEAYQWEAKAQRKGQAVLGATDLEVSVRFFFGTKRKCDLDNFNKLWQDALTGIVYEDDSQIAKLTLIRDYDRGAPRIEIAVNTV